MKKSMKWYPPQFAPVRLAPGDLAHLKAWLTDPANDHTPEREERLRARLDRKRDAGRPDVVDALRAGVDLECDALVEPWEGAA